MSINLIVAVNNNYSIGDKGKLLYRIKKDLNNFKKLTSGNTVVFGKNTFLEIGKALPNRTNIVLTSDESFKSEGVIVEKSFQDVLDNHMKEDEDLYICGGSRLYSESLPYVGKAYITFIDDNKEGDTKFSFEQIKQHFELVSGEYDSENGLNFAFAEYVRKEESHEQISS